MSRPALCRLLPLGTNPVIGVSPCATFSLPSIVVSFSWLTTFNITSSYVIILMKSQELVHIVFLFYTKVNKQL